MHTLALGLIGFVAFLHVYIAVLESLLWATPYGRKTFRMDEAKAETTRVLALNQGCYNLVLAAGLIWALCSGPELAARATFFLLAVAAMGVVGAATALRTILFIQTVPALLALGALWLSLR